MKLQRKAGILLHPTSLPSPYGIGDLGKGAYNFIDFLVKSKQKLWQILPTGPTSFGDSPYQSFSTFAGNTLLLCPQELADQGYLTYDDIAHPSFHGHMVDYGKVYNYKTDLYKKAFANFKPTKDYDDFVASTPWLNDYALFVALKWHFIEQRKFAYTDSPEFKAYEKTAKAFMSEDLIKDCYYGAVWSSWPKDIANREPKAIDEYTTLLEHSINQEKFLQYQFFKQWQKLKTYANENDIQIIGDIPIFVSSDSCDVWSNKDLFFLNKDLAPTVVAGVPPDYFSETGQLWGNPLYDWKAHKATKFKWWIDRVSYSLKTVDIIRIDHFRGFEAYWSVKNGQETAIKGKWEKGIGEELFVAMKAKIGKKNDPLPIIAEDLGVITEKVEKLRDNLGLPGMKILQFAFGDNMANAYLPHNYTTSNCVVYTGTHDNDTTIGWYNTASEKERDAYRRYTNTSGDNVAHDMMRLAYSTSAAYCIIPLQDVLAEDQSHRMNTPGVAENNWRYRFEQHCLTDTLAEQLAYLVELYNR